MSTENNDPEETIRQLEEGLEEPLNAVQRQRLADRLRGRSSQREPSYLLPDGGGEPCFVFRPLPAERR